MTTRTNERTCVGCRRKEAADGLVRLVVGPGQVVVDAAGGAFGRGVHVHASRDCVTRACRGGFAASLKRDVRADAGALCAAIREAYERRAVGLILGARRAGHLALGADAVAEARGAKMVIVAVDAGADVRKRFARSPDRNVRVHAFGTKASLGELFGTGETAVFGVCHEGVAASLERVLNTAIAVSGSEER